MAHAGSSGVVERMVALLPPTKEQEKEKEKAYAVGWLQRLCLKWFKVRLTLRSMLIQLGHHLAYFASLALKVVQPEYELEKEKRANANLLKEVDGYEDALKEA